MTKIGEEKGPREQTAQQYHKDLERGILKFHKALVSYHTTSDEKEKVHSKAVMDEQLALIRAASSELHRRGVHKEEVDLEKRYRAYLNGRSEETYAAIEHDLVTLRDYNLLS